MNNPSINQYRFSSMGLANYNFKIGNIKFPNSIYSCNEYMSVHSDETQLSSKDKMLYISFLRSLGMNPFGKVDPRFSYTNFLFNGKFFI